MSPCENYKCLDKVFTVKKQHFTERLPKKPYCSDDLDYGLRIRILPTASRKKYFQPNRPDRRAVLVFDIDRPFAAFAWEENHLPEPNFAVVNPENGHAHLVYNLEIPVLVSSAHAHDAPIRFLAAIQCAYTAALRADRGYSGLIMLNPIHSDWHLVPFDPSGAYDLNELAEYVDLSRVRGAPAKNDETYGLGRNCTVFDELRKFAYTEIRAFYCVRTAFVEYQAAIYRAAIEVNRSNFPTNPLSPQETAAIARSIARWTWQHLTPEGFSEYQRRAAAKTNAGKRIKKDAKRETAYDLRRQGLTVRAIAARLGVSLSTAKNYLR